MEWKMNNVRDNIFDEDYLRKYHFYQLMMLYLHKHNGDCPYLKNNVRFQLHTMRFQLDTIMNRQFIWAPWLEKYGIKVYADYMLLNKFGDFNPQNHNVKLMMAVRY